jgi:hypothetical protein
VKSCALRSLSSSHKIFPPGAQLIFFYVWLIEWINSKHNQELGMIWDELWKNEYKEKRHR